MHVRDDGRVAAVAGERSPLYYLSTVKLNTSTWGDVEVRRADPEERPVGGSCPSRSSRVRPLMFVPALSPDSRMLAMPLLDGPTMNLWVLPTSGEPMRPVTSFDDRSVLMTRQPSWSSDSRHLYAAVAEIEIDVVLLDGLCSDLLALLRADDEILEVAGAVGLRPQPDSARHRRAQHRVVVREQIGIRRRVVPSRPGRAAERVLERQAAVEPRLEARRRRPSASTRARPRDPASTASRGR